MNEIVDLDILRPEKKIIKLAGKEIDVSFVPCGITFEVDDIIRKLSDIDKEQKEKQVEGEPEVELSDEQIKRGFELSLQLCSVFASVDHPELTTSWFKKNVSSGQLTLLVNAIKAGLNNSYIGVERYGKN